MYKQPKPIKRPCGSRADDEDDCPVRVTITECPGCAEPSEVYLENVEATTMGYAPFYDKDGRYHTHDPNRHTRYYRCSNGHKWKEKTKISCWCGWPESRREFQQEPTNSFLSDDCVEIQLKEPE